MVHPVQWFFQHATCNVSNNLNGTFLHSISKFFFNSPPDYFTEKTLIRLNFIRVCSQNSFYGEEQLRNLIIQRTKMLIGWYEWEVNGNRCICSWNKYFFNQLQRPVFRKSYNLQLRCMSVVQLLGFNNNLNEFHA